MATVDRLVLVGPSQSARLAGGAATTLGGLFAGVGLNLLRHGVPGPLKLLPLAFTAVSGGLVAAGAPTALGGCSVEVSRAGVTLSWKLPVRAARTVRLAAAQIETVEVITHAHSDLGPRHQSLEYRLAVVTTAGHRLPFETHGSWAAAEARRLEVLRRLSPPEELPQRPATPQ